MNEELNNYIKEALSSGMEESAIRKTLIEQGGWSNEDLDAVFNNLPNAQNKAPSLINTPQPTIGKGYSSVQTNNKQTSTTNPIPDQITTPATPEAKLDGSGEPSNKTHRLGKIISVILIILILGGGTFAFAKFGNFSFLNDAPYNQDNLISGLLVSMSDIDAFSNTMTGVLKVEPRDEGAKPFKIEEHENIEEYRRQYFNDNKRIGSVNNILRSINGDSPSDLQNLLDENKSKSSYYRNFSITDPVTNQTYLYKKVGNDNFELTITFETDEVIKAIERNRSHDEASTKVNGHTVTFTKDSYNWYYFPSEPPTPYLEELGEMARFLPPEFYFDLSISVDSNSKDMELANWKFAIDVNGDFGDLIYKVAGDAMKIDDNFYLRARNFPGILGVSIATIKGFWIKIPEEYEDENRRNYFSSIFESIPEAEEEYKENRKEIIEYTKEIAKIADEEKLLLFVSEPVKEKVDGVSLYKYTLEPNKDAIVPFIERSLEVGVEHDLVEESVVLLDETLLEYLKSEEFEKMFEYVKNNTSFTLWVDKNGILHKMEYSVRAVPPDTAIQLKDKQIRLNFEIQLRNINKPAEITAPEEYKDLDEVLKEFDFNLYGSRIKAQDASTKASLQTIRVRAELYYDEQKSGTYGSKSDSCDSGMFTDETVVKLIENIKESSGEDSVCRVNDQSYAVSMPLLYSSVYHFCVDSTGYAGEILSPGLSKGDTSCN